jgi:hypothetical protein
MTDQDYKAALNAAMKRFSELCDQRDRIEVEMSKLRQFIHATENMLSDEERANHLAIIAMAMERAESKEVGLTEAIRRILQAETTGAWITVAQVRDRLVNSGFDFSGYMSNPLASVSTTMKRFKPEEIETIETEGVTAYRWKGARPGVLGKIPDVPQVGWRKRLIDKVKAEEGKE